MNIKNDKVTEYNHIIRNYSTEKLEKLGRLPIAVFSVSIKPVAEEEHLLLTDWCGSANAEYIAKRIEAFDKVWIGWKNDVASYSALRNSSDKKDRILADIADCIVPAKLSFLPTQLFRPLEEEHYFGSLEQNRCSSKYAKFTIPYRKVDKDFTNDLEINVLSNWINVRQTYAKNHQAK